MSAYFGENVREDANKKFAESLKYLRQERWLGQRELADKIGVGKSIISDWEKCVHEPSLTNLIVLALFFDVSLDDLCGFGELKL